MKVSFTIFSVIAAGLFASQSNAELRSTSEKDPYSIQAQQQADGKYRIFLCQDGQPISQIGKSDVVKEELLAKRGHENFVWRTERATEGAVASVGGAIGEFVCLIDGGVPGILASPLCVGVPMTGAYLVADKIMDPTLHKALAKAMNVDNLLPGANPRPVDADILQLARALEYVVDQGG